MLKHPPQLSRRLNDSSEGWTIVRDEEYSSPYAYSKTGIWVSYEDPVSAAAKVREHKEFVFSIPYPAS